MKTPHDPMWKPLIQVRGDTLQTRRWHATTYREFDGVRVEWSGTDHRFLFSAMISALAQAWERNSSRARQHKRMAS